MSHYKVKPYRLGYAVEFILEHEQKADKLSNNFRGEYLACFQKEKVIGVTGYSETVNTRRIKMVIVQDAYRDNAEVYNELIQAAVETDKEVTVFAPPNVKPYFLQNRFKIKRTNPYGISFMKLEQEEENHE